MKYGSVPALNEYIAMKAMFNYFGREFELPVPLNDAMLKFGEAHSPEYACFPFKLYLGYLKQLAEKGVTDIFVHGLCDIRSCRYVDLWEGTAQILRENGYPDFRINYWGGYGLDLSFEQLKAVMGGPSKFKMLRGILIFCLTLEAADKINDLANKSRPREKNNGETDAWLVKWNRELCGVKQFLQPHKIFKAAVKEWEKIALDNDKKLIKVAFVGDMFKVHEPFSHFDTIRKLNRLGAEVRQSLQFSLIFFGMNKVPLKSDYQKKYVELMAKGKKYLRTSPASFLDLSVGEVLEELENGAQGIVHFQSFGCMPDLLLKPILDRIAKDHGVPIIHFLRDTHSSDTQYQTRLEAFVDLIKRKQKI